MPDARFYPSTSRAYVILLLLFLENNGIRRHHLKSQNVFSLILYDGHTKTGHGRLIDIGGY